MRKAYYLSTPNMARSRTPKDIYKAFVWARLCLCAEMRV